MFFNKLTELLKSFLDGISTGKLDSFGQTPNKIEVDGVVDVLEIVNDRFKIVHCQEIRILK